MEGGDNVLRARFMDEVLVMNNTQRRCGFILARLFRIVLFLRNQ